MGCYLENIGATADVLFRSHHQPGPLACDLGVKWQLVAF